MRAGSFVCEHERVERAFLLGTFYQARKGSLQSAGFCGSKMELFMTASG
jgi:hypothetical protein